MQFKGVFFQPTCPQSARRRRDVDAANQNTVLVFYGPIKVERKVPPKKSCNKVV